MATDRGRVLIVEDDRVLARSVGDILRIHGYPSQEANSGGRGLELIEEEEQTFSVALVDLRLPDMNGMDVVSRLGEVAALTEVVILTGNASIDSAVDALRKRSCDYLVKPVAPEELVATVQRGVRRWQHRLAEEDLRRDRERFQQVIEALSDVVMVLSTDGAIQYQSPAAPWVLGHRQDDVAGTAFLSHVTPEDRPLVDAALERARDSTQAATPFEFRLRRSDGTLCLLEALARPLRSSGDAAMVVTCRDITERRRLENELRQTQKLDGIGRLAGGIAHDFNNQLSAILTSVELAAWEPDLPERVAEELDVIRSASERAANLTRQLLIFSRKDMAESRRVEVEGRVEDMVAMLRRLIPSSIDLVTRYAPSLPEVLIDPTQLEQTVMNLVVNARDALPSGGTITIDVSEVVIPPDGNAVDPGPGAYVAIAVTDDGVGMPDDVVARVFEPFFTTKEAGRGTGLGLATCYGIVMSAGGHIGVETEVGKGTTVRVQLPAFRDHAGEPAEAPSRMAAAPQPKGEGTILFVEDDDAVREGTTRLLARLGYTVLAAAGGEAAIARARAYEGRIDLIVADLIMPGMTGPEVVDAVRAIVPDLPALFVSGYADEAVLERLRPGNAEILQKPIRVKDLHERIQALIG
jgi:hypothetical protein